MLQRYDQGSQGTEIYEISQFAINMYVAIIWESTADPQLIRVESVERRRIIITI